MQPSKSLSNGLVWGVIVGLTAGAFVLGYQALGNASRTCEFPDTEQCIFEHAMYADVARLESYGAIGLVLIAAGLFLLARRRTS